MSWYRLPVFIFFASFSFSAAAQTTARYDVIIDEIMPDPTPLVGLPNAEFAELKNTSGRAINLSGWRLATSSSLSGAFPNYTLPADSFLIITSGANAPLFSTFGRVLGITSFPALPNEGSLLTLLSKEGMTIHAVNYTDEWYNNAVKKEGGWTLEMIDTKNPCAGSNNWIAATDPSGGTPGRKNSKDGVNKDTDPPRLLRTYSVDSTTIIGVFDEGLDSTAAVALSGYSLLSGIPIVSASVQSPLFNQVILKLSLPLQKRTVYTLKATTVKDCSNNLIAAYNESKVGLPEEAGITDLVINEILFNPRPNAYDYIELYNRSNKILDASKLYIANRSASGISSVKKCSETPFFMFPDDYIVLTEDAVSLIKEYFVQNSEVILQLPTMPSYPDDKGTVLLLNSQGAVIDEVNYSEKWHFALISNAEGVALERVNPSGLSQEAGNWHSASSTAGYGTPGSKNSQYLSAEQSTATIAISPAIFSPDNDGYEDIATINYRVEEPGYAANIYIFNAAGRQVRHLVKNAIMGIKGNWTWDGLDEKNQKLPIGRYIIYTDIFNLQGNKKQFKNTLVLARKLN